MVGIHQTFYGYLRSMSKIGVSYHQKCWNTSILVINGTAYCFEYSHNTEGTTEKVYIVFYQVKCALFYKGNYDEILPAHYSRKVLEKGFKIN
jgi:hypothetical protein